MDQIWCYAVGAAYNDNEQISVTACIKIIGYNVKKFGYNEYHL